MWPVAAPCSLMGGTGSGDLMLWKYRPETVSDREGEQMGVCIRQFLRRPPLFWSISCVCFMGFQPPSATS